MGETVTANFRMKRAQIAAFVKDPRTVRDVEALQEMLSTAVPTVLGGKVDDTRMIISGAGLTGGGDLTADLTLNVGQGTGIRVDADTINIADTTVTAGSYGDSTHVSTFTVNQQGQLTAAASVALKTPNTVTFQASGGAAPGTSFDGSAHVVVDYSTIGAQVAGTYLTANQTITLTGDVTGSGTTSIAATIANNAVTTAKINNAAVTLAKIQNAAASSKLLGSGASGSGSSYAEISLGSGLSMSGTTLSASGGSGGGWTEALWNDFASANATTVECDVTGAKEIMIIGNDLVNSGTVQRVVQCSVNGGSTWYTASGDYDELSNTGAAASNAALFTHATQTTAARSFAVHIVNNGFGRIPHANMITRGIQARFKGSTTAINRIRVSGSTTGSGTPSGTYTAGTVQVLTR